MGRHGRFESFWIAHRFWIGTANSNSNLETLQVPNDTIWYYDDDDDNVVDDDEEGEVNDNKC